MKVHCPECPACVTVSRTATRTWNVRIDNSFMHCKHASDLDEFGELKARSWGDCPALKEAVQAAIRSAR